MCSGLTAFSALKKVQRHPGIVNAKDVLVLGLGGLGFQGLGFALPMLGGAPLAADIDASKLKEAQKYGCMTFNSSRPDAVKEIKAASFDGTGIGAVVDFVGNVNNCVGVRPPPPSEPNLTQNTNMLQPMLWAMPSSAKGGNR